MSASQTRQQTPLSISLRPEIRHQLDEYRAAGGQINVSAICGEAIAREIERKTEGDAFIERLRGELTERRGAEWSTGRQEGRRWAELQASWLQVTEYATRHTSTNVAVADEDGGNYVFYGTFAAPLEDYGKDWQGSYGAPCYPDAEASTEGAGGVRWQTDPWKCERYWRGWLTGVREIYDVAAQHLPDVTDQLPPLPARKPPAPQPPARQIVDVDPDDIPF